MSQKILYVTRATDKAKVLEGYLLESNYSVSQSKPEKLKVQESILVLEPDFIVIYTEEFDESFIEIIELIQEKTPLPIIIFADRSSDQLIIDVINAGASSFIMDGIEQHRIHSIIEAGAARFNKCQSLKVKLTEAELKLDERRDVDRAKGILMSKKNIAEDDAYKLLRKMAMDKNLRIGELSKSLIAASELF